MGQASGDFAHASARLRGDREIVLAALKNTLRRIGILERAFEPALDDEEVIFEGLGLYYQQELYQENVDCGGGGQI